MILDFLFFCIIISSILVITAKNPVLAIIYLIFLFVNTAGYLIFLGIGFIGLSYIIIYIGAITVLFLFIIMMINIRLLDILEIGNEYTKNLPLALLVGLLYVYDIFNVLPFSINNINIFDFPLDILNSTNMSNLNNIVEIKSGILNIENLLSNFIQIEVLGQGLYTYGSMWLLISSIILLLSMISAIILGKNFIVNNK